MATRSDDELILLIKEKDTAALNVLFNRYESSVFSYIHKFTGNKELAKELLQETFTRIWFSAPLYRDRGSASGWIFTIARNAARNEMAKKRYSFRFEDLSASKKTLDISAGEKPDAIVERKDARHRIMQLLEHLKPELREVLIFKHFQQLKFREIADITKTSESTLKSRYKKAITELRTHLQLLDL